MGRFRGRLIPTWRPRPPKWALLEPPLWWHPVSIRMRPQISLPPSPFSLSLSVSLFLSVFFSVSFSLSLSLSFCLYLSVCLYFCLSVSVSLCLCLSVSVCHSLSVSLIHLKSLPAPACARCQGLSGEWDGRDPVLVGLWSVSMPVPSLACLQGRAAGLVSTPHPPPLGCRPGSSPGLSGLLGRGWGMRNREVCKGHALETPGVSRTTLREGDRSSPTETVLQSLSGPQHPPRQPESHLRLLLQQRSIAGEPAQRGL